MIDCIGRDKQVFPYWITNSFTDGYRTKKTSCQWNIQRFLSTSIHSITSITENSRTNSCWTRHFNFVLFTDVSTIEMRILGTNLVIHKWNRTKDFSSVLLNQVIEIPFKCSSIHGNRILFYQRIFSCCLPWNMSENWNTWSNLRENSRKFNYSASTVMLDYLSIRTNFVMILPFSCSSDLVHLYANIREYLDLPYTSAFIGVCLPKISLDIEMNLLESLKSFDDFYHSKKFTDQVYLCTFIFGNLHSSLLFSVSIF